MEEAGELKRPIYLVQLHQRATMFPFQLFKPTGSGLLSPTASHRYSSPKPQAQTLSAHQLNTTETPTTLLALFFSKPPTRLRNLKSTDPRDPITIHPARRSIAAEDRPSASSRKKRTRLGGNKSRTQGLGKNAHHGRHPPSCRPSGRLPSVNPPHPPPRMGP